jgi:NUMOD4 motif
MEGFGEVEIWRLVPGFERYRASSMGRIQNVITGNFLKPQPVTSRYSDKKYVQVRLMWGSKKRHEGVTMTVHRIIGMTFPDLIQGDSKLGLNHKNGIKTQNDVDNLERMTQRENCQHAVRTGLMPRKYKYQDEVQEMIRLRQSGLTIPQIQQKFKDAGREIPKASISTVLLRAGIVTGRRFKWSEAEALEIIRMRESGMSYRAIQAAFGAKGRVLPSSTLSNIMNGRRKLGMNAQA